jgi:CP family cyanate transporter-like MFS transporter
MRISLYYRNEVNRARQPHDMHPASNAPSVVRPALLITGILLIAATLRAPITGIGPVLTLIQQAFGLGTAQAGFLTTLPLLAFALFSPLAPRIAARYGLERTLFGALGLTAAGIIMRSLGSASSLFVGTGLIGAGIAVGNVLLPSLVKRDFPQRIAGMTGAYAVTMAVAAALGSATAVPLAEAPGMSWQLALGAMLVLPAVAMVAWIPQLAGHTLPTLNAAPTRQAAPVWRSALAWQVTLFIGLNSFLYYVLIGWLPSILTTAGYSATEAGSLHGLMQLASGVPGLFIAPVLRLFKDQRAVAAGTALLSIVSLLGLLLVPAWAIVWAPLFGFCAGTGIILALMFMGLRTRTAPQAAALSGMAQCIGYLLAACGPPLIGALHDVSGGWQLPLGVCAVLAVAMAAAGLGSGRAIQMPAPPDGHAPALGHDVTAP